MHPFVLACAIISTVLAVYCVIPYVLSIIRGQTKPHQFTWLIFTIMNGIVMVSQFLEGARASVVISVIFFLSSGLELGLSFKYGVRNSSKYDRLLLGAALLTIIAWLLTRNNALAIWLTVLIDVFATTMLVLKIKKHPGSEPFWLWFIATMAFVFTCLSLADKPFGVLYVRPIYGVLSDGVVLWAILRYRPKRAPKTKPTFPEVE
ncbi:MAG TPA: hypothetical protein VLF71_00030 [Candidatus Saccharimonadales bacterium]|nr:hypothetical protein [Candidatus Saccharimonadales bacterium]